MNPNEERMANEKISKLVLSFSIPTIIGMLVNAVYNIVDRFWVGKMAGIGTSALTGLGLCMPVMNIVFGCTMLVGIGAAANISISIGKRDKEAAERILGNTLSLIVLIACITTIIGLIFAEQILLLVGADSETLPYALPYLRIILAGSIFQMVSFAMNHPIRAMGNPKRFASTQLLGGITNIILDPLLIFTFKMGIEGAALATIIAQLVSAIWVMSYHFSDKSTLKLRLKNLKPKLATVIVIFSIGFSPFIMQVANSFVSVVINLSLKHYGAISLGNGNIAIGAMTVIGSVSTIFFMPIFGINQGTQPIIGYNYGAGDYTRLKDAFKWGMIYSVIIMTVGFVVIELFAPYLVIAFNNDEQLVSAGALGMRIFLCAMPLLGFQIPSTNFFTAIGRANIAIFLSLLRQVLLLIPLYLILPLFFGLTGVWIAAPVSDIIATIASWILIEREFKRLRVSMH